ncbi:hypothetical protein L596_009644 [Steinernema carpocapsae]|uniref:Uncharacterized protein n=1 Tax=Steinernema carpocapsae TaxID=34508 RepID=A0A4U5PFX8_STECR|nr:hypothetical protein L596_009644 [Steinernema carpocapsae]
MLVHSVLFLIPLTLCWLDDGLQLNVESMFSQATVLVIVGLWWSISGGTKFRPTLWHFYVYPLQVIAAEECYPRGSQQQRFFCAVLCQDISKPDWLLNGINCLLCQPYTVSTVRLRYNIKM